MSNENANQPAFPMYNELGNLNAEGLTKREFIAVMAMQGMIAGLTRFRTEVGMEEIIVNRPQDIAEISCVYADAIIGELSREK